MPEHESPLPLSHDDPFVALNCIIGARMTEAGWDEVDDTLHDSRVELREADGTCWEVSVCRVT